MCPCAHTYIHIAVYILDTFTTDEVGTTVTTRYVCFCSVVCLMGNGDINKVPFFGPVSHMVNVT